MTNDQLLSEVENLIRTMPPRGSLSFHEEVNLEWLGRAAAVLEHAGPNATLDFKIAVTKLHGVVNPQVGESEIVMLLRRIHYGLRLETRGPAATVHNTGQMFDYFDELRKIIEQANKDLLFVDPYLEAEFVARYLGLVKPGVTVRLLGREKLASLVPAAKAHQQQYGTSIQVRSAEGFHDRFVFVDQAACYQSGASFKDGAVKAPVTITSFVDAFKPLSETYEALWAGAKVAI